MIYPINEQRFISAFAEQYKAIDDKKTMIILRMFAKEINKAYEQGRAVGKIEGIRMERAKKKR